MDDQETKADIPRKTAREELFRARNNERQRFDREHHVLETLELVTKQMDAAVTRCSHDLRYLWANQGYADWIKRPLNEIVGHPIVDVLGKEAFEHLQHHFVRVLTGHRVHYEEEVNFQGIGQRWISATYTPSLNPDGAANGWIAVVLDITERKRVEGELRRSEARLAAEAAALAKLDDLSSRLWQMSSLQEGLSEMLAAVVGLLGADKANVQLLDAERGVLNIVAQYGFEQPFLDFFREVSLADQSACGRSLCSGCRIVVEDIETDEAYAPLRGIARASDYRAVTSTPLVSSDGSILGMLSMHFKSPHRPTEESLLRLDLYARQAAGFVQQGKAKRVMSQRYAAIVESSDDAIISKNLDAVIVTWNAGAQRLFGYTDAEAIGQPIAILIPPELRDEENKILEKLMTGERIEHFETIRLTNAGKRINVSLTISPMRNSTGKIVGFSKIARDISERKRTEEALRASEERLRLAQHAARIGTFEWDIRSGVNTWTPELEAMYGLPLGGFGGTQTAFENLVHPDDRARVIELDNWALKTGQPTTGEWRVVWADGSIHWIAGRWQVFMNDSGEPSRMIGVNIDVTESKRAEQALQDMNRALGEQSALLQSREELLRVFVKNVPAAVAMLDRDMRYVQVSDRWCADYLSGREQVLGRSHYEIFPDMPERWKEVHRRALDGKTLRAEEDRWDARDGTHWARWEVRPWKTAEGAVGGILILAEDITRRKQMEEALSDLSRKLIESQEQERARIGRELHDDINQRLAMLSIELEQLQENPSEVQSRVQELRKQTTELSNDVQALSHDLHSSKLEYLGVVAGMKSWCKEFAERQRIEFDCKTAVSSPLPPEIGLSLFRVLQEALNNAVKHSGVKRVEVQLREDSGEIRLVIRDFGRGFDVEAASQGKGLGLTSMRERVRLVNGTISIESKPMGGTTIHVRVPLGSGHAAKQEAS